MARLLGQIKKRPTARYKRLTFGGLCECQLLFEQRDRVLTILLASVLVQAPPQDRIILLNFK
jgi:hypothetical protein